MGYALFGVAFWELENYFSFSQLLRLFAQLGFNVCFFQARHGTRRPTKKRVKELETFAERLSVLSAEAAKSQSDTTSMPPAWMNDWKSPWSDKWVGGELLPKGEEELYDLAQRYKMKYPEIFSEQYHPDVYPIIATQVNYRPDLRY